MSAITHDRLHAGYRPQHRFKLRRAALRRIIRGAIVTAVGFVIMIASAAAIIGLKSFFILSRMPNLH
jgi:hypothetical protein